MSAIEAKLGAIMSIMNNRERINHSINEVGIVEGAEQKKLVDRGLAHEGPYQLEEAQFINENMSYNCLTTTSLPITHQP